MMKYALLIGINYRKTRSELRGCINDVNSMKKHLQETRGYLPENIVVLTEDTPKKPTTRNIMEELDVLISKGIGDAELWLHYSGHGSHTRDRDGDEDDGQDETIVPLDFRTGGMITDDQLHDHLGKLPDSCKMYCILDCCHSGTILDLKYQYRGDDRNGIESSEPRLKGNIIMISGCMDTQTSADARINGKWAGAMTTSYIECMKGGASGIECEDLLDGMRNYLRTNGYTQYPQMCSSSRITEHRLW
jgi:hypothetical protein